MGHLTCAVRGLPPQTTRQMVQDNFNLTIHPESACLSGAVVEESQGNSCSTTVTFTKERNGRKRSCETLRDQFNGSYFRGQSSTISVTSDFLGLTPLSGNRKAPIHVYFTHGYGGHAFKTWCSDVDEDIRKLKAWPRDFLPNRLSQEGIDARIYTLGYNANTIRRGAPNATIESTAEDLLASLIAERSSDLPDEIYFVCHSLGGLVVCQAVVLALFEDGERPNRSDYRKLFWRNGNCLVKGILFLGTPFQGSGQANMLAPIVRAVKGLNIFSPTNDQFIKSLKENNDSFEVANIVQRFKVITEKTQMRLLIGCEETPVAGSKLTITYDSATSIFRDTATVFRIHGDHRRMVKFDDPHKADYKQLENLIVKMIRPSQITPVVERHSMPLASPPDHNNQTRTDPSSGFHVNIYNVQDYHKDWESVYGQQSQEIPSHFRNQSFRPFSSADASTRHQTVPRAQLRSNRPPYNHSTSDPQADSIDIQNQSITSNISQRRSTDNQTPHQNDDDNPWNRLKMFETVFIVDDTGSMIKSVDKNKPHGQDRWAVTVEALRHVADIAAQHDENGIDIKFLKAQEFDEEGITNGVAVMEILRFIDFQNQDHGGGTTFQEHLEGVIEGHIEKFEAYLQDLAIYRQRLRERSKKPKRPDRPKSLNLIVITDGQADDEEEVENYIVQIAKQLDELRAPAGYIGIQFVQVGDDEHATKFLERLDDDIKKMGIRDIVDTTPYTSETENTSTFQITLRKVLLGAVTRKIDDQDNHDLLPGS